MPSTSGPDEPRVPDAAARGWHAVEGPDARTVQVPVVPPAPRRGATGAPTGAARQTSTAAERRARVQADQRAQAQARAQKPPRTPARAGAKAERSGPAKTPEKAHPSARSGRTASSAPRAATTPAGSGPARPAAPRASSPPRRQAPHHHEPSAPAGALANLRARFVRTPVAAEAAETRPRATSRPAQRRGPATGGIRIPKGRASSRPGGPTTHARGPEARNRIEPARARGSWLSAASWRVAVLAGVLVLAAAVVLPSLRSYFRQQEELADLASQAQAAQVEVEELRADAARWDDPAYVVAQARERLAFVFPGETPYRVIDPETVEGAAEGSPAAEEQATGAEDGVWYTRLWGSIAGGDALVEADPEADPAAETSPAPTSSGGD